METRAIFSANSKTAWSAINTLNLPDYFLVRGSVPLARRSYAVVSWYNRSSSCYTKSGANSFRKLPIFLQGFSTRGRIRVSEVMIWEALMWVFTPRFFSSNTITSNALIVFCQSMLKCCSVLLSPVLFLQSKRVATSTKPPPSSEPKVPGARGDYFNSHLQKLGSVKGLQSNAGGTLIAPLARRGDYINNKIIIFDWIEPFPPPRSTCYLTFHL